MNVNRPHQVIFKRPLSIIKSLDNELRFYVPFNRISVISGQWNGKHEWPYAMKRRLASERISPSAMRSLLVRSRKQENVTLTMMPIIWIGTKTICHFPICGLADGWGSGYNESVMFCFFDYFVQNRWYKWYKKHKKPYPKRWIVHQSFVPTAPPHVHIHKHTNGE